MNTFGITVVTPDTPEIVVRDAVSAVVPSAYGSFGVLAGHAPTVSAVRAGILRYMDPSGLWRFVTIGDGVAEVTEAAELVVSVAFAKPATDESQAEDFLQRASALY